MSELLNWYIEELRQQLADKMPAEKLDNVLREAESHLLESARNRISGLADERAAMEDAINAYGLPKKVALSYLRRMDRRILGMRPVYASLLGCFVAIYCWIFAIETLSGFFDNFGESWQNYLAAVIGVLSLGLIIAAARVRYRSNRGAISLFTVGMAAVSIPVMSFWMINSTLDRQGISRFHLSRDTAKVREMVGRIETAQALLTKGMATWKTAPSGQVAAATPASGTAVGSAKVSNAIFDVNALPPDLRDSEIAAAELGVRHLNAAIRGTTEDKGGRFVVPREYGAFAMVRGDLDAFETVEKYQVAEKAWATSGPAIAKDLDREHTEMLALLKSAEQAQSGRVFFFNPELSSETVIGIVFLLPLLLLVDGLAALTARPKRAWPKRRLA